jgi:hypothetical protein
MPRRSSPRATLPSPAKAFRAGKTICATPPSNNHTLILYFNRNAARRSGGLSYQRRRIPVIPCSGGSIPCSGENHSLFPVRAKTIPCFNLQGIRVQDIEINI